MVSLVLSGGFLADWMRKKIHTTAVRKIMTLVCTFSYAPPIWYAVEPLIKDPPRKGHCMLDLSIRDTIWGPKNYHSL